MDLKHLDFAPYTSLNLEGIKEVDWLTVAMLDEDQEGILFGLACAKFQLSQAHLDFSAVPYVNKYGKEDLIGFVCFSAGAEGGAAFSEHFTLLVSPFNYDIEDRAQIAWVESGTALENWRDHFFESEPCGWSAADRRDPVQAAVHPMIQKLAQEAQAKLCKVFSNARGSWELAEGAFDWFDGSQMIDGELSDFFTDLGTMEALWPYSYKSFQD